LTYLFFQHRATPSSEYTTFLLSHPHSPHIQQNVSVPSN